MSAEIRFDAERHFLGLAVSDAYPELAKVWTERTIRCPSRRRRRRSSSSKRAARSPKDAFSPSARRARSRLKG